MSVTYILQIVSNFIYLTYILDYFIFYPGFSIEGNIILYTFITINEITTTIYILAWIFFLIHSKKNDKLLLYVFILTLANSLGISYLRLFFVFVFGP